MSLIHYILKNNFFCASGRTRPGTAGVFVQMEQELWAVGRRKPSGHVLILSLPDPGKAIFHQTQKDICLSFKKELKICNIISIMKVDKTVARHVRQGKLVTKKRRRNKNQSKVKWNSN